jgi:hypothetical protein
MNKKKYIIGIYKITSPTGKVYIGQATNMDDRIRRYKTLNCRGQRHLYLSLNKYGWDKHKFEVIEFCEQSELNTKEKYYIGLYNSTNREIGLNLQNGGLHFQDSEETKLLRKLNHPKRKEIYAERDGVVQKFYSMTDAEKILGVTRKSIRMSLKDPNVKIGKYSYSYEYPTTTSHNVRTRIQTKETRNKISLNSGCNKKIYAVFEKEIMEFRSIAEASRQLGDTKKVIGFALRNPSRSKSKYKYFTEYPVINELN